MIYFTIRIDNPLAQSRPNRRDFFCKDWKLSKNKNLEVLLTWFNWQTLFELHTQTHWRGHDHAGPRIELTILGLFFNIQIYDRRHWNYEANRWYLPDENID